MGDGEQKEMKLKHEIFYCISLKDTYFVVWKRVKNEETKQPRFSKLGSFVSAPTSRFIL